MEIDQSAKMPPSGRDQAVSERLAAEYARYVSFSAAERAQARISYLTGIIEQVQALARAGSAEEIALLTEMVPDLDIPAETDLMVAERLRRGAAMPVVS